MWPARILRRLASPWTERFAPRLPPLSTRLSFTILWRGQRLRVDIGATEATYTLHDGGPVPLAHHGQAFTLTAGQPVTHPIPPLPAGTRPRQPHGRAPRPRPGSAGPG